MQRAAADVRPVEVDETFGRGGKHARGPAAAGHVAAGRCSLAGLLEASPVSCLCDLVKTGGTNSPLIRMTDYMKRYFM